MANFFLRFYRLEWLKVLELKNVKKVYHVGEDITALNGVSIGFGQSGLVSILGPSGCGKTTLLNVIGGLDEYDSGDVIVKGKSTKAFKSADWDAYRNNCIGFVFQGYNLISHQTVLKNVEVALTLSGISKSQRTSRAKKALEDVGLGAHLNKKPSQLSGGQMQRVAIARALVNNPEIILADEPTGALDSKTSVQIMDILKEISKEKLVIMVTHNKDLAQQYSSRIINMLDGEIHSDSEPDSSQSSSSEGIISGFKKTSMSIITAIGLSFSNLMTKKGRTFLTSLAGGIGIIGIALVLALSNAVTLNVKKREDAMVAGSSISISETGTSYNAFNNTALEKYPTTDAISVYDPTGAGNENAHFNNITAEYIAYIEKMKSEIGDSINSIEYDRKVKTIAFIKHGDSVVDITGKLRDYNLPSDPDKFSKMYSLIGQNSKIPTAKNEIVISVDKYNRIDKSVLDILGINKDDVKSANDLIGKTIMKVANNDDYYVKKDDIFEPIDGQQRQKLYNSGKMLELKVVGVVRAKKDFENAGNVVRSGIAHTDQLSDYLIENSLKSKIVLAQKSSDFNVLTNVKFKNEAEKEQAIRELGGRELPSEMSIYPASAKGSKEIVSYLNAYNEGKNEKDKIIFEDFGSQRMAVIQQTTSMVTGVLISFSAISLIVSSIMIAILTYVSVMERTKEIGILRSIGARKRDVSRLFNAETSIIGFISGVIGIVSTLLLTVVLNPVMVSMMSGESGDSYMVLDPVHAVLLIILSVVITVIAGFIPAKMASRKKPVEALRTE